MLGSIFNTSYNLNYFSNINDKSNSFKINFKDINFQVQNILNINRPREQITQFLRC